MTPKLEQAARQALEALEYETSSHKSYNRKPLLSSLEAITALREALDPELQFVRDWNDGKVRRVFDGKVMGVAEQAEQEPVSKALRMAEEALVYHTEQTRPIQKTDEAIVYLRNVMAQGVLNMTFTLEDAMAKYPEISYWHNEFLKHNTTTEQAEQKPVAWVEVERGIPMFMNFTEDYKPNINNGIVPLYAAPVRTKDLTESEIDDIWKKHSGGNIGFARDVIAADREKNK